jgi:mitogen-activated protein kinase kinase
VWSVGISLIELALGRFPFSDSDDTDEDEDRDGTLAPGRPLSITTKKDRRKSKGVSLQGGAMMMSILELLQHIVNEPAPRLSPEERFSAEAVDFTDKCLLKDPDARLAPKDLLVSR